MTELTATVELTSTECLFLATLFATHTGLIVNTADHPDNPMTQQEMIALVRTMKEINRKLEVATKAANALHAASGTMQ